MKPVPTRYNGVLFRSRLEARWAAFFDLEGIRWEYEPDKTRAGWWPDFRVSMDIGGRVRRFDCEVKPVAIDPILVDAQFAKAIGGEWVILLGDGPSDPIVGVAVRETEGGLETVALTSEADGALRAVESGAAARGHVGQQFRKATGIVTQAAKSMSVNAVIEAYTGEGICAFGASERTRQLSELVKAKEAV